MTSELQRIAQGLISCLDQVPATVAHLQHVAAEMRQEAARAATLGRAAERVRHQALLTLQAAGDDYEARARASHAVEQATRAMRACQVAALSCDFAANRCDEAAHYTSIAPPEARAWAVARVNGINPHVPTAERGIVPDDTHARRGEPSTINPGSSTDADAETRRAERATIEHRDADEAQIDAADLEPEVRPLGGPEGGGRATAGWATAESRQAWVSDWGGRPEHRQQVRSTADWAAFQRRHAGDFEIKLTTADGAATIWADGLTIDPDKVVAIEAKFVTDPPRSMYEGRAPDRVLERLLRGFDEEMSRYGDVIRDQANPVARLRLVVNTEAAARFLGARAQRFLGADIDLDVQVRQEG